MDVSVRDATPDDAAGIAAVQIRTWQHAYAHVFPSQRLEAMGEEERAEWWKRLLTESQPAGHTLVVDGPGGVVGFASLGPALDRSEAVGELYSIYVLPEASGRGAGRALMAETLSRLHGEGFDEAILWVLEDNPRTHRFYRATGWRADGAVKDETMLETPVREVRYRISLRPSR